MAKNDDARFVATAPIPPPGAGPGTWAFQPGDEIPPEWVAQHRDHLEALAPDGPGVFTQTSPSKVADTAVKARENAAAGTVPSPAPPPVVP